MDNNTIFYNADYIVIEYIDMLKSPYLILLNYIRKNDKIREILKLETIDHLDDISLYEWYINRKHMNFLIDLNRYPDKISDEEMDEILEAQMNITPAWYRNASQLLLYPLLGIFGNQKIAKNIIIYHPHDNNFVKEDIERTTDLKFIYVKDFKDAMDIAKENSTYFISDVRKLDLMKEHGCLSLSSVTLPIEYRYNKKNMTDFNFDFSELYKDNPFKLSYMRTCTFVSGDDSSPEFKNKDK